MAAQQIFERVEKKYIITSAQCSEILKRIEGKMAQDKYGKLTTICNIYYDTPTHRLIRDSIEKPVYKEKLRLRSYGTPKAGSKVFVELKKKYKGVVYKRRVDMSLEQSKDFLENGELPGLNPQIEREIAYFLKFYEGIAPAMYLSYEREAYAGIKDPELRITFDKNIIFREKELFLENGSYGRKLLPEDMMIMEIKIPGSMPLWLSSLLCSLNIYPGSFSKYGTAYQTVLREKLAGEEQQDDGEDEKGKVNYCA
ncbi:MAG: polyphosphate polymerase domain-containing protein [Ruminococcus sp.]|nr:polyphosphate polymerase domain-containing protein [Ruminococcus sp.]